MIVWALVVTLATGPAIPIDIYPDSAAGADSCTAAIDEAKAAIKQEASIRCERWEMKPTKGVPDA